MNQITPAVQPHDSNTYCKIIKNIDANIFNTRIRLMDEIQTNPRLREILETLSKFQKNRKNAEILLDASLCRSRVSKRPREKQPNSPTSLSTKIPRLETLAPFLKPVQDTASSSALNSHRTDFSSLDSLSDDFLDDCLSDDDTS